MNDQKNTVNAIPKISNADQITVLLAEDHKINQKLGRVVLQQMGFKPDVVSNGQEAVKAVRESGYDVVFMDVQMPLMDGLEATQQIRTFASSAAVCIIAMTANVMDSDRESCLEAGMDDYIAKPIQIREIVEALRRCGITS